MSLRSLERTVVAVGLALTLGSLLWRSAPVTAGVAIGAAAMWLNFRWLRRIVVRAVELTTRAEDGGTGAAAARLAVEFSVKFIALAALVYLLITRSRVDPLGLLVGLSTLVVAGVIETLRGNAAGPPGGAGSGDG